MATKLAQKITETRAAIADGKRAIERAQEQIKIFEIRLQAYLELGGRALAEPKKPKAPKRVLFKSEVPWDRALAAIRSKPGAEFTTDDLIKALTALKSHPKRSTVRDKLTELTRAKVLERVADGRYRFLAASDKKAA